MTIEAKGKLYDLIPLPFSNRKLTRFDGELIVLHLDASISAIRVISDDELARVPYVPSGEPYESKKGEWELLVGQDIRDAKIKGQILEKTPGIVYRIDWHP